MFMSAVILQWRSPLFQMSYFGKQKRHFYKPKCSLHFLIIIAATPARSHLYWRSGFVIHTNAQKEKKCIRWTMSLLIFVFCSEIVFSSQQAVHIYGSTSRWAAFECFLSAGIIKQENHTHCRIFNISVSYQTWDEKHITLFAVCLVWNLREQNSCNSDR